MAINTEIKVVMDRRESGGEQKIRGYVTYMESVHCADVLFCPMRGKMLRHDGEASVKLKPS